MSTQDFEIHPSLMAMGNSINEMGAAKRAGPKTRTAILFNYRRMREQVQVFESLVLDLLAHPDSKPEEIAAGRKKLIKLRKDVEAVWKSVDRLFNGQFIKPEPPHHIVVRQQLANKRREQEAAAPAPAASASPSM